MATTYCCFPCNSLCFLEEEALPDRARICRFCHGVMQKQWNEPKPLSFAEKVAYVLDAHTNRAKSPSKSVRKWDGKTPYAIHPIWCATTLMTETSLPEELRRDGADALLFHDLLEDTIAPLPKGTSYAVKELVLGMTFPGGFEEEKRLIWGKSIEVRLLKIYDKVSNLLDGSWMTKDKRLDYAVYLMDLVTEVQASLRLDLNIFRIACTVAKPIVEESTPAPKILPGETQQS